MATRLCQMLFYSSVILNSTETTSHRGHVGTTFYSSVILNSTETKYIAVSQEI